MDWYLYIVRCNDGSLYTGITTDIDRRLREHRLGGARGAGYLRGRAPLEVVFSRQLPDRASASRAEYAVKQLAKARKELLAAGTVKLEQVVSERRRRPGDS
jgi:putative endonuclease